MLPGCWLSHSVPHFFSLIKRPNQVALYSRLSVLVISLYSDLTLGKSEWVCSRPEKWGADKSSNLEEDFIYISFTDAEATQQSTDTNMDIHRLSVFSRQS